MNQQRIHKMGAKVHYRLYKSGKQWVTVCLSSVALAGVIYGFGGTAVHADTTTATAAVTQSAEQDTPLTAQTVSLSQSAATTEQPSAVSSAAVDTSASAALESDASEQVSAAPASNTSEAKPEAATSTAASDTATPATSSAATQPASAATENVTQATAATLDSVKMAAAAQYQATGTPEKVVTVDDTATAMPEVTLSIKTSDGKALGTEASMTLTSDTLDTLDFPAALIITQDMIDRLQAAGVTTEATPSRYQYQGARINNGALQTEPTIKIPINLTTDATGATVAEPVTLEVIYDPIDLAVDHVYTDGTDATGTDHDLRQIVMTVNKEVIDTVAIQKINVSKTITIDFNADGTVQLRTDGVTITDLTTLKNDLVALNVNSDDVNAALTELAQALKENSVPLFSAKTIRQALTTTGIGMDGVVDNANENLSPDLTHVQYVYDLAEPAAPVTDANADLPDKVTDIYHQFDDVIAENAPKAGDDATTEPTTTTETSVTTPETDATTVTNQQADVTLTNNVLENGVITPIRIGTGTGAFTLSGNQTYTKDTTIQLPASFTLLGQTYQFVGYTLADDGTTIDPATLNPETDVAIKATTAQPVLNTDGTAVTDQYGQPVMTGTTTVIQSVYQVITPSIAVDYVYDDADQTPLLTQTVTQAQASLPNLGTDQLQKIVLTPSAVAQQNGAPATLTLMFNSDFTVTHLILNAGTDAETTLPVAYETVGGVVQNEVDASQVQAVLNDLAAGGLDESSPNTGLYQGFLAHLAATGIELNGDVTLPNLDTYDQLSKITYVYTAPTQQQAVVQVIDENNNQVLETKTFTGYPGFTADTGIADLVAKYQAAGKSVLVNDVPTTITFDDDAELAQTYALRVANEVALTVNWIDATTGKPVNIGTNGSSWSTSGVLGTTVDLNAQLIALEKQSGQLYRITPDYIAKNGTTVTLTGDALTLNVPVETAATDVNSLPLMVLDNRGNLPLTSINYQTLLNDPTKVVEWIKGLTAGVGDTTDQKDSEAKSINLFLNMYAPNVQGVLADTDLSEAERIAIYDNLQQKLAPLVMKEGIKILPVVGNLQQTFEMAYAAGIDEIDWGNTAQYSPEIAAQIEKSKALIRPTIVEVMADVLPSLHDIATDVETQLGLPAGVLVDNLQYTTTNSQLANKQILEFSTANEGDIDGQNEGYTLNGVPLIFEATPLDQATLSLVGGDSVPYILRVNLGRVNVQVNISDQNGQQLLPITTIGTAYDNDNTLTIPAIAGYTFVKATSADYQLTTANGQVAFVAPTDGNVQLVYQQNAVAYTIVPTVNGQPLSGYEKGVNGSGVPGSTIELPVIPGYTTTATPTVPATGGMITVTYTPNEVTVDVTIPSNLGPKTVSNVTGKTGDGVAVKVPDVMGYTPDKTTVPATVNPNGTITTTAKVTYTPNEVTADVTIPSNLGPKVVSNVTGKTGDSVAVKVPDVMGYTPDKTTVPATVNPNGTITTTAKVTYTPNEVTADVTIPSNLGPQNVTNVTGKTGDSIAVKVPSVTGYTPDKTTVPATVNPNGTITTTAKVTYTPNTVTTDVTIPSNLGPKVVSNVTGKTGDSVTVEVPAVTGYTPDKTTVPATVNPNGTITTTAKVTYTPNEVTADITIPSNLGPKTVSNVTGKTGDSVAVKVPAVTGYTPDKTAVPATVNPNGTITTTAKVTYTPNEVTADVTIPSNLGPKTVSNVTGKTGDSVAVKVPSVTGYTPDKTTVPATVNPNGTITTTAKVTYTPNEVTADVTIPSNLGPKTVSNVTGKTGDGVAVKVPDVMGYTPDKTTVPATVNPDGTITTTAKVTYTPNKVTADVTIPSNLGPKTVTNITGKTGDKVSVTVPRAVGYTADKITVTATVNPDGTITTTEKVAYTPNQVTTHVTVPSNRGPQTVPNITGKTGEQVNVPVPTITGYTADKATVPATVNADGTITTNTIVTYLPQKAAAPVQKQVKRNTPTQTGAQATLPQTSAATAAWLTMAGLVLLGTTGLLINVKRRLQ